MQQSHSVIVNLAFSCGSYCVLGQLVQNMTSVQVFFTGWMLFLLLNEQCQSMEELSINTSNGEFVIAGLKKQIAKTHHFIQHHAVSICNLGFLYGAHLTYSDQI